MTSYAHLTYLETFLMTIIAAFTNLGAIPIVLTLMRVGPTKFEAFVVAMSIFTSFMYHLCQIYDFSIFLNELQWHRLDNIFAITSFELVILHALGSIADEDIVLRWSTLLSSIVIQQKDPWNIIYTVAPCILFTILGITYRIYMHQSRRVRYDWQRMRIGISTLVIGLFFFYLGLDDPNDYLRVYHGIWHICASLFGYYCFSSVSVTTLSNKCKEGELASNKIEF